jgi:hypothetical protein
MIFRSVRYRKVYILFILIVLATGCVINYTPQNVENEQALVVEGMMTDQAGPYQFNISLSSPIWTPANPVKMAGCKLWITDDNGGNFKLSEGGKIGTYFTDPSFTGVTGRTYTLNILTNDRLGNIYYKSYPTLLVASPGIDSIYYEKKFYTLNGFGTVEGCQILLNTHDPLKECRFYRWEYTETWEFTLPYDVLNKTCWVTQKSGNVLLKNASSLQSETVSRFPLLTISNPVDRLLIKYSMLVNQYSLSEDEFYYWEKVKNMTEETGGLYDIIPASIPSNVYCPDDITRKVYGYFCVSSVSTKRIFIRDSFSAVNRTYQSCPSSIFKGTGDIPGLNDSLWVITTYTDSIPLQRLLTNKRWCATCLTRGAGDEPSFWHDDEK